jgi:hypothetical protein
MRKAKHSLTLLEVAIALVLTGILLSVLWKVYHNWYKTYETVQVLQAKAHKKLFVKERLEKLSSAISTYHEGHMLFNPSTESLCFCYKGEADPTPSFNGMVRSLLYVDSAKQLCLASWSSSKESRIEVLKDRVSSLSFAFFDTQTRSWSDFWEESLDHLPLFVKVIIKTPEGEESYRLTTTITEGPILYLDPQGGS